MKFIIWRMQFMPEDLTRLAHALENVVKCPKIRFLVIFLKTGQRIVLFFCTMMEANELNDLA